MCTVNKQTKTWSIVRSKFTDKAWLINRQGKRVTPKFKLYGQRQYGPYEVISTSEGKFVYHIHRDNLTYIGRRDVNIWACNITDKLFAISVPLEDKCYVYDNAGKLISTEFSDIDRISNDLIAAKKDTLWGFVDEHLNWVIQPQWQSTDGFNEYGYAKVHNNEATAVINKKGEVLCDVTQYWEKTFITAEMLLVSAKNNRCVRGVINLQGKVVIPLKYDEVVLKSGYFIVSKSGEHGLIDLEGNIVFDCIYPEIIETEDKFIAKDLVEIEVEKRKK